MVTFRTVGGVQGLSVLAALREPDAEPASPANSANSTWADDGPFAASIEWRALRGRVGQAVAGARASGSSAAVVIFACSRLGHAGPGSPGGAAVAAFRSVLHAWGAGEHDLVAIGADIVGVVLPDWHPEGLANLVDAMAVRSGMPAFAWGAGLYPSDGDCADDLLSTAVARLGFAEASDAPELAALPSSVRSGRGLFAALSAAALGIGILVPVAMSSGPRSPVVPPTSVRHLGQVAAPVHSAPSASSPSPAPGSAPSAGASTGSSAPAQAVGSLLAGAGGAAPGGVPSPTGASAAGPSASPPSPNAKGSPGSGPGTGLLAGGSGLNGVSTASTPTTTPVPATTVTTAPTTTTTSIPPPPTTPTTTTTVPSHSGGGCFLLFCG